MKRRLLAIALGFATVLSLVGCGNGEISNDKITIKRYKGLEVEVVDYVVTDADVEMDIQSTLQTFATRKEITDRPIQNGDTVTLDYEGKSDGEAVPGLTGKSYTIEIGAGMYEFEEGIIGHQVGETFDVPVTISENNSKDLAGKSVVFTITIHKNEEVTVPELTEEFLKEIGSDAKTIKAYKAQVKKDLEKSNKEAVESSIEVLAWEALLEQCVVKSYPQDRIDEFLAYVDTQLAETAERNGTTAAKYFEQHSMMTPEEYVKREIKKEYATELIAEKEKLTVTAKEYEKGLAQAAKNAGVADVKEYEKDAGGRKVIERELLTLKVGKILVDNVKRVEPKDKK